MVTKPTSFNNNNLSLGRSHLRRYFINQRHYFKIMRSIKSINFHLRNPIGFQGFSPFVYKINIVIPSFYIFSSFALNNLIVFRIRVLSIFIQTKIKSIAKIFTNFYLRYFVRILHFPSSDEVSIIEGCLGARN